MLRGMMMNEPLLVTSILRHAALYHADTEIVSRTTEGPIHRYTYADAWVRAQKLANALAALGMKPGDRIGTLAWNGFRHLECYYGIGGSGMVCHTINPRLFPEQIRLHRQPCRRPAAVHRPDLRAAAGGHRP
ncbi:AMP-binding protein [Azospirillum sp. INR13]|uniref:AMP-binding protein n=1 Tax=Azospirillum sp. INR13 TaxID=2596919 RepID=UPI00351C29C1